MNSLLSIDLSVFPTVPVVPPKVITNEPRQHSAIKLEIICMNKMSVYYIDVISVDCVN